MDFGPKLKGYRERAGMSQNALARAAELNPASINRLESGERSPSNRALVEKICEALGLNGQDRDALLASAGHLPGAYSQISLMDPTLLLVAETLGNSGLPEGDIKELRSVLETLCHRWTRSADPGGRT